MRDDEEYVGRRALEIYRSYGHSFGWSPEKCQMLVEDYQDELNYEKMSRREGDKEDG